MKQRFLIGGSVFLAIILLLSSCSPQAEEADPLISAGEIHEKVLTVDTHADTPSRLLSGDWKIGDRHDPEERGSGCIDLPRLKEGGLDAEFFAVYTRQGELSPGGYANAKDSVDNQLDARHPMEAER